MAAMNVIEILNNLFVEKVFASSLGSTLGGKLEEIQNGGIKDTNGLVNLIVEISVPLGVICVVLLAVYGGYLLMSSRGDPDKIREGKEVITNAIIGFVVILLCVGILLLISNVLGLNVYN